MNSEILGKPAEVAWAFIFTARDNVARHPAQLYESLTYLLSFIILYYTYWYTNAREKQGYMFGLFLVLIFGSRIFNEMFKESQGGIETVVNGALNTGQLLSIPIVLIGLYYMFRPSPTSKI